MPKKKKPPSPPSSTREQWRQDLILNNRGLVYECSKQFKKSAVVKNREDLEDLCGEGFKALCKSADEYDPEISEFSTFACFHILNSMRLWLQVNRKVQENETQFPAYYNDSDDKFSVQSPDVSIDSPPDEYGLMLANVVSTGMKALNDKDKEAIRLRFYEDMTYMEMGAHLGVSFQAAQQAVERALAKMRDVVDPEVLHEKSSRIAKRSSRLSRQSDDLIDEIADKTGE